MKVYALIGAVLALFLTGCTFEIVPESEPATIGSMPDYDRDRFGDGWADVDGDCQDTRNEILIRDLVDVRLDAEGCKVLSGVINDAYVGETYEFQRGETTSDDVQIDHIIPLAYAWRAGAWQWTDEQRESFANDEAELRAVDGQANNDKRDRGPSRWLPPSEAAHCDYATTWSSLATAYGLSLEQADSDTIAGILAGC